MEEGRVVGWRGAYRITIPSNKKSEDKIADQPEPKPSQEDGWCLTNTIHLAPDQAQQFVSFLEQHEANLEKVIEAETAERRRILAQVYSLILSWRDERGKGNDSIKSSAVQEQHQYQGLQLLFLLASTSQSPRWLKFVE